MGMVAVKQTNNQTEEEHQFTYQTDLGLWKSFSNDVQEYFISKGNGESQNITDNLKKSKQVYKQNWIRYCLSGLFTRIHPLTYEKSNHTWLCYSPKNGKVYCFMCKLLSSSQTDLCQGFNDWKNAKHAIEMHEKSPCFLAATLAYIKQSRLARRVEVIHEEEVKNQMNFWRSV